MGSTEQKTLQTILQAIIDQGNLTVTEVNASVGSGTDSLEVVKNIKLQELAGAAGNHTITLEAKAQELVQYISEQGFRIRINQANHGFTFNPIQYDTGLAKYVKATKENPADAMAIKVDNDNFDLVTSGSYPLSSGIKDVFGKDIVEDEYYFLDENVAGGFTPIKPIHIYQPLFLVAKDKGKLRALIEVETPTDLEPRIMNDFFDEQVERVVNTADEKIEEIKTTQGMKGDKGDKGDTGAVGPQGIQGIQGLKGEKGDTGSQGLKGDKGDQGIQGPQGIKGDTGIQGPIGPQGDKGDKGDAGSLINIANDEEVQLWLGTTADYEAIVEKSRGILYQHFDEDGNFAGGYYKSSLFLPPFPDKRISLCMYADFNGLRLWNTETDPMPIKTMNMAGLQKWEETEDYIIHIDKDAVMTTVEKYAPGSYQTFMDRKADIDNSRSLLKGYNIEWTQQDDSDLFIQCNNEAISKIDNQPMTLDEPTQPIVLEPKTVPTTYECCFRMDKKSEEFYIGEGYENLVRNTNAFFDGARINKWNSDGSFELQTIKSSIAYVTFTRMLNCVIGDNFSVFYNIIDGIDNFYHVIAWDADFNNFSGNIGTELNGAGVGLAKNNSLIYGYLFYLKHSNPIGSKSIIKAIVTKTSTPKPFVKSVMPSGKLAFVASANETTHTFLNKGDGVVTVGTGEFNIVGEKIEQLLVYKGLLTQAEKDAELAKNIRLK